MQMKVCRSRPWIGGGAQARPCDWLQLGKQPGYKEPRWRRLVGSRHFLILLISQPATPFVLFGLDWILIFRLFSKGGPPDVLSLFSHVFVS